MSTDEKPWLKSYPLGVPEQINPRPFPNLCALFDEACTRYGKRTAYISMRSRMSYKRLYTKARAFAAFLQQFWNLGPGDKIGIMMPNLMQYPVCLFGALKAGLTVVNINPLYTPRELQLQLADSKVKVIVVLENFAHSLETVIKHTSVQRVIVTKLGDELGCRGPLYNFAAKYLKRMVPGFRIPYCVSYHEALFHGRLRRLQPVEVSADSIAFLQYTGGTTGRPKGAMLSHGNLLANVAQINGMYREVLHPGSETVITALPLYHIFAMTVNCIFFVAIGGTNILIADPRNIQDLINNLKRYPQISIMTGVNTLFNAMLNHQAFEKANLPNLRLVIGGGAAVQSGVDARFYQATGMHILEGYGLTECSPLCTVCPSNVHKYTGTIGVPVPSTTARIVSDDGKVIEALNEPGELEIAGPQVMQGYFNNEKATAAVRDGDFIRTGDIAVWQEGGFIKIIDRRKDMILVSGFNVFPSEIEDVVSRCSKVLECAVIGVPSDSSGEAVKLFVVKRDPELTAEELIAYCRKYLTAYKVPHLIEFVKTLPKSAVGKVLRRKLREREQQQTKTGK